MAIAVKPEIIEIARRSYIDTEAAMKKRGIVAPYPKLKDLPYGVSVDQVSTTSAGGTWMVGQACKKRAGLRIMASVELRSDDNLWYHISFSRGDRIPSYADSAWIARHWLGNRWAIQCFMPEEEHVNIHPNCLHLWHSLTGDRPFPDFRTQGHI